MFDRVRAARGAAVAGLATLGISAWFASAGAVGCDGGAPVSAVSALGAFQMARSTEALNLAIGCVERLDILNSMNRVDLYTFIVSYGLFLILATLALASGRLRRLALMLIGVGLVGDVIETATQLWIGAHWPAVETLMLQMLAVGSSLKFAGLALGSAALGASMAHSLLGMSRWLGAGVAAFGLLELLVFIRPGAPFGVIAMLLLLAACAINARRAEIRTSADV